MLEALECIVQFVSPGDGPSCWRECGQPEAHQEKIINGCPGQIFFGHCLLYITSSDFGIVALPHYVVGEDEVRASQDDGANVTWSRLTASMRGDGCWQSSRLYYAYIRTAKRKGEKRRTLENIANWGNISPSRNSAKKSAALPDWRLLLSRHHVQ